MLATVQRTLADYCAVHGRDALFREFAGIAGAAIGLSFLASIFVMLEPLA